MSTLRRAAFGLALLSLAGSAVSSAQCPGLEGFKAPAPGSWAEYKTSDGTMRMSLLGAEAKGIRMEMAMTSKDGPMVMQMVVPGYPYEMTGVSEMVMQRGQDPAMRMPSQMLAMIRDRMPKDMMAEACRNARENRVGEETITVPAGTFRTIHFRDAQNDTDIWVSMTIPFGMVQMKGHNQEMVLTGQGSGAKSSITGPIQDMPMGGMPRN